MKENRLLASHWSFFNDQIEKFAYWENFLTKKECKNIIKIGNKHKPIKARVGNSSKIKTELSIRKSSVNFLYPEKENEWLFRRLTDVILDLNKRFFKFDISGLSEGVQFTHYKAPDGMYKKHTDMCLGFQVRKLSISVQLSDPSTYEGGDLLLHQETPPVKMPRKQGTLLMFPSYTLHEVTPVTKNERYSLVCWVNGKQFK